MAEQAPVITTWLGRMPYRECWALQRGLAEARRAGTAPDMVLFVEHPPTITLGRRGTPGHILIGENDPRRQEVAIVAIDRGGDVTFHGPGQVVMYPVLHLARWGGDVLRYVRMLEEVGIVAARTFGLTAERETGLTGVWVGDTKLAAIGVRVSRWVTTHGLALNVSTDLTYFDYIVPCGLYSRGVTSLAQLLGRAPSLDEGRRALARAFAQVFDVDLVEQSAAVVRSWSLEAPPEPAPSALQRGLSVA